jgi:hypothetical protein
MGHIDRSAIRENIISIETIENGNARSIHIIMLDPMMTWDICTNNAMLREWCCPCLVRLVFALIEVLPISNCQHLRALNSAHASNSPRPWAIKTQLLAFVKPPDRDGYKEQAQESKQRARPLIAQSLVHLSREQWKPCSDQVSHQNDTSKGAGAIGPV